jgi:hypothetical protein
VDTVAFGAAAGTKQAQGSHLSIHPSPHFFFS